MALTTDQIALLRKMVDEEDDSNGWTVVALNLVAAQHINEDGSYAINGIAGSIWRAKAATYVEMVNTSESGSSRSAGQMFDHAIKMAELFEGSNGDGEDGSIPAPRSTRIVRAVREG